MANIENLTLGKKELMNGLKKIGRDSILIFGGIAFVGWIGYGTFTGDWNPKSYVESIVEGTYDQSVSSDLTPKYKDFF